MLNFTEHILFSLPNEELQATAPVSKSAPACLDPADRRIVCKDMSSRPEVGRHGGNSGMEQGSFGLFPQRQMD